MMYIYLHYSVLMFRPQCVHLLLIPMLLNTRRLHHFPRVWSNMIMYLLQTLLLARRADVSVTITVFLTTLNQVEKVIVEDILCRPSSLGSSIAFMLVKLLAGNRQNGIFRLRGSLLSSTISWRSGSSPLVPDASVS